MKTRYTCPMLMHILKLIYQFKLRKTHDVYWCMPYDVERSGKYVAVRRKGKGGGRQLSARCLPKWLIHTEIKMRNGYRKIKAIFYVVKATFIWLYILPK